VWAHPWSSSSFLHSAASSICLRYMEYNVLIKWVTLLPNSHVDKEFSPILLQSMIRQSYSNSELIVIVETLTLGLHIYGPELRHLWDHSKPINAAASRYSCQASTYRTIFTYIQYTYMTHVVATYDCLLSYQASTYSTIFKYTNIFTYTQYTKIMHIVHIIVYFHAKPMCARAALYLR